MTGAEPPERKEPARFEAALPEELLMSRLPAGRHGLSRAFIESNQRLRIIAAMLRVLPRHGYSATTIGHVTREASVSRAAFYDQFDGKEDCFLATFDFCADWVCSQVEAAVAEESDWRDRIRVGTSQALRLLAANPPVAHLIAVEGAQAGQFGRERQESLLERFAAALRADHPGRPDLPDDLADLLLGGFVTLVARYVDRGRTERLPEATQLLVEYLLIPYMGGEEASAAAGEMPAS